MALKDRLKLDKDPLYLIDGSAYVYRAFYAYPDLKRSDGFPTNALFIVLRLLLKLIREENPKYLGFFLDGKGPTFRHEMFDAYKAQRSATPEPLIQQLVPVQEAVKMLGFSVEVSQGVEADDLICSMAHKFKAERPVVIIGADKDLKQCLDENVFMWDPVAKKEKITTLASFREDTGLEPAQWPDFQALIGDSSDNIPGVPGVGPKTAEKIFADYPTLEAIKENVAALKPAIRKKMEPHVDDMFLYRELTSLRKDLGEDVILGAYKRADMDPAQAMDFLKTYEFESLARDLNSIQGIENAPAAPVKKKAVAKGKSGKKVEQLSLFGMTASTPTPKVDAQERTEVDQSAGLPALRGLPVGLVLEEKRLVLGVGTEEFVYTGPLDELCGKMQEARIVYCPCLKEMLRFSSVFERVPLALWCDLGLAAYLLNPEERGYTFDQLMKRRQVDVEVSEDNPGLMALALGADLEKRLKHAGDETYGLDSLLHELETPLAPVLASMEDAGIGLDLEAFSRFLQEVQSELDVLTEKVYTEAGGEFNIRSSQQMAQVLFEKLGLKPAGKTPGGSVSTSVQVLEKLRGQHEVIEYILEFRKLEKLRSTYLEPLPKLVDKNGRVHTTLNQMATATGRLSSSNPNLQNIPIRGEQGKRMRSCFTAQGDALLVAADYSQIELRVLAHLSQDPTLVAAFQNNEDIHSSTARVLYEKELDQISSDERRNAKTINFGLIYGMGPQKLARELKITLKEAKAFIERYFSRLSVLKEFYERVEAGAKEMGYVTTLSGRRRLLPDINSKNQQLQSLARRQAINTVIQGSAADIIKIAMLHVAADAKLKELDARLILQIHDELILETPTHAAQDAGKQLAALMETVRPGNVELCVPLSVDWGTGKTWADAH